MKKINTSILVFVKYPAEGKVKTRLAHSIGTYCAKEIYRTISSYILKEIRKLKNANIYYFYSSDDDILKIKNWIGEELFYFRQSGRDLGEKMENAFKKAFDLGAEKAIIIGTDIPGLNSEIISKAIAQLNNNDFVIGPSFDGGYYLLGMKCFYPTVFKNIEYSTSSVFENTIKNIKDINLSCSTIDTLLDIDTEEDLNNWLGNRNLSSLNKEIRKLYTAERK